MYFNSEAALLYLQSFICFLCTQDRQEEGQGREEDPWQSGEGVLGRSPTSGELNFRHKAELNKQSNKTVCSVKMQHYNVGTEQSKTVCHMTQKHFAFSAVSHSRAASTPQRWTSASVEEKKTHTGWKRWQTGNTMFLHLLPNVPHDILYPWRSQSLFSSEAWAWRQPTHCRRKPE